MQPLRQRFELNQIHNLCSCGGTLYVRYDLPAIKANLDP